MSKSYLCARIKTDSRWINLVNKYLGLSNLLWFGCFVFCHIFHCVFCPPRPFTGGARAANKIFLARHLHSHLYLHFRTYICISPVHIASMVEFWKERNFFERHFAPRSIVRKGVLPKNCSLLWDWTPSHAQRIYKGQNSENPLRAITFDWSDLRTWFQRLWATFLMLFSGIPHLPTFRHVACVTSRHVTSHKWRASRMSRVKCHVR